MMTINEKQELVRLLHLYMADLVVADRKNKALNSFHRDVQHGVKAQYEHARIIASKIAVEVNRDLRSN